MNLEKLIPDNYGQLENDDLALSEGRIRRIIREGMDEEQTLDGDVPHVINCVLSRMLDEITEKTLKEGDMMAKIKEAHLRSALRDLEIEEEYSARSEAFIDQLRSISNEMERTAEKLEKKQ
ncbi:hypothetical protein [Candidatus Nanohalovita haloferacivicina]|uniref:hypothetical protein n=1 Tax=Candidatus Nanohalovita haloferacivicina TaxID=2978046 RepID=UPI00325F9803|nr:hypothetical protein HBNXNv_0516 [Candidatus Nanohalobia archaeon BNXNv]